MMPNNLETLLATTVEGLAADSGRRVYEQIAAHGMHSHGEAWLSEGLRYIRDEKCPFCSQALDRSLLSGRIALISVQPTMS
jgi:wobble nucleotide-excising tRNase